MTIAALVCFGRFRISDYHTVPVGSVPMFVPYCILELVAGPTTGRVVDLFHLCTTSKFIT